MIYSDLSLNVLTSPRGCVLSQLIHLFKEFFISIDIIFIYNLPMEIPQWSLHSVFFSKDFDIYIMAIFVVVVIWFLFHNHKPHSEIQLHLEGSKENMEPIEL